MRPPQMSYVMYVSCELCVQKVAFITHGLYGNPRESAMLFSLPVQRPEILACVGAVACGLQNCEEKQWAKLTRGANCASGGS